MKIYIVLGAPRTGTSLIAGMLHEAGVSFGDQLNDPHPINPAGFFEDADFQQLHKAALDGAGAAWNAPPTPGGLQRISAGDFRDWAEELVEYKCERARERGHDAWGFKNLRGLWLMSLYVPILACHNVMYIATHRNPLAAAQSFRRAWPQEYAELSDALKLVAQYELGVAQFLRAQRHSHVHVSFERLFDDTEGALAKLERTLGRRLARGHLDPTLRHF